MLLTQIEHTNTTTTSNGRSNFRSLAFWCIVVLSEKRTEDGYYRYCYHHNHLSVGAAIAVINSMGEKIYACGVK